jgi:phage gp29-like protein
MPPRNRYPQGEIATVTRDFIVPTYGGSRLQPQDEVLLSRGGGGWTAYELYSDIAKDAHLAAVLGKRYGAVVGREWEVKPGDDSAKAQKAADMVRDMLTALADRGEDEENGEALISTSSGFDAVSLGLLSATLYGFQPAEIIWDKSDNLIYPSEVKIKDLRRFAFITADLGYKPRLLTWTNQYNGDPLPPRKFIFHRFCALPTEDPYGLGLGGRVFFPVFFKRNAVKFWLTFADKFASPTLVGRYPNGTKEADRDKLLDALMAFASEAGVAIPDHMQIDLMEASRSTSMNVYDGLVDFCNREISKVILGETGSTDQQGSGGSRARDQVGNEVRIEVAKMDADMLSETINRTIVKWAVQLNMGFDVPLPKVWRKFPELENKVDRTAEAGVISTLTTAGFKPTREWVSERLEIELEEEPAGGAPGGGPGLDELLNGGLDAAPTDAAPPDAAPTETPPPELSEALDFGSIIDRVITYQDLKIGVEYLPGHVRFPKRRNSKKLRSGYGHIRGYKGADGEALDCYLAPAFFAEGETPTDLIFEIRQMAMDGDFDEHKFMLGYPDQATAKAAYLQELPPEFFGGIRAVDRADLDQYRKPVEMAEQPEADRDIVDEYQAKAAPTIAGEIRDWTDRISRSLDAAADLEEFRDKLFDLYDELPPAVFAELMGQASIAAEMAGRFEVVNEAPDVELAEAAESVVEFAKAKKKARMSHNCKPSRSHGCVRKDGSIYCVSLSRKCRMGISAKAKAIADYIALQVLALRAPAADKTADGLWRNPTTHEQFIENGRAIIGPELFDRLANGQSRLNALNDAEVNYANNNTNGYIRRQANHRMQNAEYDRARWDWKTSEHEKEAAKAEIRAVMERGEAIPKALTERFIAAEQTWNKRYDEYTALRSRLNAEFDAQDPVIGPIIKERSAIRASGQEAYDRLIATSSVTRTEAAALVKQLKLPRDKQIKSDLTELAILTDGQGFDTLKSVKLIRGRANASPYGGIEVRRGDTQALAHELGHHVEFGSSTALDTAKAWVQSRATDVPQPLRQLTGGQGYRPDEIAYPDKFVSPYAGKVYPNATEVISMGLERVASPQRLVDFASTDPDHFAYTVGILRNPKNART